MARRRHRRTGRRTAQPEIVHPEADLHALADWLKECRVTSVAMESTGVYWIPVFQILEARGFEVVLVKCARRLGARAT